MGGIHGDTPVQGELTGGPHPELTAVINPIALSEACGIASLAIWARS